MIGKERDQLNPDTGERTVRGVENASRKMRLRDERMTEGEPESKEQETHTQSGSKHDNNFLGREPAGSEASDPASSVVVRALRQRIDSHVK
jgi:hypothetical protein